MKSAKSDRQLALLDVQERADAETYTIDRRAKIVRRDVLRRNGHISTSEVPLASESSFRSEDAAAVFDSSWLRAKERPSQPDAPVLRVADLFSGCGGLSIGVGEACRALGKRAEYVFATDINEVALDVYRDNFDPAFSASTPIETLVDGALGAPITSSERALRSAVGEVDFVVAGPPCQGHSDLNNHTRREDPKNQLVARVARFVEVFRPAHVLIENVRGIRHDRLRSLEVAKTHLQRLGYVCDEAVLHAETFGVAQKRSRYFLYASTAVVHPLLHLTRAAFTVEPRPISWAISDLVKSTAESVFDTAATHSAENQRRIDYLFDNALHDLPDAERPPCHRSGGHSYKAVYGRLRWDLPAPTITTGFGSMGQGRFVHPLFRRTLTPHEAARLQFFPDHFSFGSRGRRQYQELIGNAVPSKLAYAVVLHELR